MQRALPGRTVRWLLLSGWLLALPLSAGNSDLADPAEGNAVHAEFRQLMGRAEYANALKLAQDTVRAEESRNAPIGELAIAYHQLGEAQLRSGDLMAARASLERTLQLLESTESIASPRFVEPLVDLAEAHAALGSHDEAISALQRAILIARRADGLFSNAQLELLDRMAMSFEAIGDIDGVDQVRRYAVLIAESRFGPDHPDCLPAIEELANWFEISGRYGMARNLYERMVRIASLEGSERNATVVNALVSVGRSHRLQYVETPELIESGVWGSPPGEQFDPVTGQRIAVAGAVEKPGLDAPSKLNRRGLDALQRSLEILSSVADPPPDLLARSLLELGDWHQTGRESARAISYYKRAWPLLEEVSTTESPNPLLAPRPMFYRPPPKLHQDRMNWGGTFVRRQVKFEMTITDRGDVADLVRVGGDMSEGQGWRVARALNQATFSPRFEKGEPVATIEFQLAEDRTEIIREEADIPEESAKP